MMTFNEYLEDVLDLHVGLMSEREINDARESYKSFTAPRVADPKHPDMKKTATELRSRCERLVSGQSNAVAKFSGASGYESALIAARASVAEGRRILSAKRVTKAEYIAHAEMNSDASRKMNAAAK